MKEVFIIFSISIFLIVLLLAFPTKENIEKRFLLDAKVICLDGVEYWHTFETKSIAPKYNRKGQVTFCDEDM